MVGKPSSANHDSLGPPLTLDFCRAAESGGENARREGMDRDQGQIPCGEAMGNGRCDRMWRRWVANDEREAGPFRAPYLAWKMTMECERW